MFRSLDKKDLSRYRKDIISFGIFAFLQLVTPLGGSSKAILIGVIIGFLPRVVSVTISNPIPWEIEKKRTLVYMVLYLFIGLAFTDMPASETSISISTTFLVATIYLLILFLVISYTEGKEISKNMSPGTQYVIFIISMAFFVYRISSEIFLSREWWIALSLIIVGILQFLKSFLKHRLIS